MIKVFAKNLVNKNLTNQQELFTYLKQYNEFFSFYTDILATDHPTEEMESDSFAIIGHDLKMSETRHIGFTGDDGQDYWFVDMLCILKGRMMFQDFWMLK